MSSRLSPAETAILCSWPSFSMKVTHSSSPSLGGSTWPCRLAGLEENGRVARARARARAGRCMRKDAWGVCGGAVGRCCIIIEALLLLLYDREAATGRDDRDKTARERASERVNMLGVTAMLRNSRGQRGMARALRGPSKGTMAVIKLGSMRRKLWDEGRTCCTFVGVGLCSAHAHAKAKAKQDRPAVCLCQ